MELLIEELNERVKEGYVDYDSLIEILKIIDDMVESKTNDLSFIEKKILMIMLNNIGKQKVKDTELSYSDNVWQYYKKADNKFLTDDIIKKLVNTIKASINQNKYCGYDIIYLLLAFKRSFNRAKSITKIGTTDLNIMYDYMSLISGIVCGKPDYNFEERPKKFKKLIPATNNLHFK